jgi:hypothetical protein
MASAASLVEPLTRTRSRDNVAQAVILTLLYSLPALWSMRSLAFIKDNDIWWHLASGNWILQHHAIPRTDPFSAYGMGKPWAAYSWAFELPAAWLVAHLGLVGLLLMQSVLIIAIVVALHRLIASVVPDFTIGVVLTLAAVVAMDSVLTPRPWLFTILFFVLELHVILRVRQSGRYRQLFWLPLLFCAWANLHVLFIYGLFLLVLAASEAWWRWWKDSNDSPLSRARNAWTVALIACVAATLLNPELIGIYKLVYNLATQPGMQNLISELHSIQFRSFNDYLLLLIGLGAIATLASRRETQLFPWALLLWAMLFSFRSQRDVWMMAVVGAVTIAASLGSEAPASVRLVRLSNLQSCCIALCVVGLMVCAWRFSGLSSDKMQKGVAVTFPAAAVEFVKANHLPGPLYNHYDWGGYLIWTLPEIPVSMDGRSNLHGTPRIERSAATWKAEHDWDLDAELQNSRLVIGAVDAPLCAVLRLYPRYQLIYEDKVASVFVRRPEP